MWLYNLSKISLHFFSNLDVSQVFGILLSRIRSTYKFGSFLYVFDLSSFNILMSVSLHVGGDEDVEFRRAPKDLDMCSSLNLVIGRQSFTVVNILER